MKEETDIYKRRSRLSPAKQALLEKRLKGFLEEETKSSAVEKRPDQNIFPISFAQERFWFLDRLDPGSPAYNRPMAFRLRGSLDVQPLEQAISEILRRHEVLRSNYSDEAGKPIQSIKPAQPLSLALVDLSDLNPTEREEASTRLAVEEALKPFDLAEDLLLRASLFRLGMEDHILLVVIHHIACDGWSARVFTKELADLYEAFSTEKPSPLPELPIQYADYAHWQRRWLQGEVLDRQVSYWRERLSDEISVLNLPTDLLRQNNQTYRGQRLTMTLSSPLLESLNALSRREDVTLFMTLLAAFKVLLYQYTGQEDIVVGTPTAGRTHAETEGLIGFFVNTLVLRTDLSGDLTFRQLLHRVREVAIGAYEHGDLPFEKLVEVIQPVRDLSRSPLFQVLFNLENMPEENIGSPRLCISEFEFDSSIAAFDLSFEMVEKAEGLYCLINYSTDLFDSTTITRMIGHFKTLLESIVADSNQSISRLPILTRAEQHQLLVEWNNTRTDYPKDKCIHELFEGQVEQTPDSVAVVFPSTASGYSEDQYLTYQELNARANQLANYLRKLGVDPEVLVGICAERSLEMIVGILGILKAGGAYVPLDPTYPQDRLAFMLEDAQISVLLTEEHLAVRLPKHNAQEVYLDTDWKGIARESEARSFTGVRAENTAYVIYTSGSTGRPKGVVIEHKGLCNVTTASIRNFGVKPETRLLQHASLSFDNSTWEIFMALVGGATLCLGDRDRILVGSDLAQMLEAGKITMAVLVPSVLATLSTEEFPNLQTLLVGGESCPGELAARFSPCRRFFNTYGPTEASISVSLMECKEEYGKEPPIGRPIANMQIYLLDGQMQPVPVGIPGELYIGGIGLARGYINKPDLTAEKFIPHPFAIEPGAYLYRTGDLVRYQSKGVIEFLGRIDNQVKIRGVRIEPREIEAVLSQHPLVRECVVLAHVDEDGDKRLVSYIVLKPDGNLTNTELRMFLRQQLPEYMVPSTFVTLDNLPLNASGKVDLKSLPIPNLVRPELVNKFMESRTPIEQTIAGIWSNVLRRDQIGIYDDFFELGGHSLMAMQVVSRLRNTLQMEIPLRLLFESPTVADMAARISLKMFGQADPREVNRMLADLEKLSDKDAKELTKLI